MGDLDIYESAQKNNLGVSLSNIVKFLKSHSEKHSVTLCAFKNPQNYLISYVSYVYIGNRSAKVHKLIALLTSGEENHIRRK